MPRIEPDYELFERCKKRWQANPPEPPTPEEARDLRLLLGPIKARRPEEKTR